MAVLPYSRQPQPASDDAAPPLHNGDRLTQTEYHARYLATPADFRAELVGGIVFMASPVSRSHMRLTHLIQRWLGSYEEATPGVEALGEGTIVLGEEDEPEPDASLQILREYGGRCREQAGFVLGAPELVVEVALSSVALDLHWKKDRYEAAGVDEYLVLLPREREVRWFGRGEAGFVPLSPGEDGVFRSRRFPGLWLDAAALFAGDAARLRETLQQGLATPEHQEFARQLAAAGGEAGD